MLIILLAASLLADVETLTTAADRYDKYASIAFDRGGAMWVAYTSMRGDHRSVVVRSKQKGRWTQEESIAGGGGLEANPKLAVDGRGALWIVWHGQRNDRWGVYARRRADGRWGAESQISARGDNALHPVLAADSKGRLWCAWEVTKRGGYEVRLAVWNGRRWSAPVAISSDGSDRRPSLAAAPDGSMWIGWDSTRNGNYDVFIASARMTHASSVRRLWWRMRVAARTRSSSFGGVALLVRGSLGSAGKTSPLRLVDRAQRRLTP